MLVAQKIEMSTTYNFELCCGASYIIKQRVSFVTDLTTRSDAVEVEHVFKLNQNVGEIHSFSFLLYIRTVATS